MTAERFLALLNSVFGRAAGGAQRPVFFDIDQTAPALRLLDRHCAEIQQELQALLVERERIPRYHEVSKAETYISGTVNPDKSWRVFMLKWVPGGGLERNRAKCPRTAALVDRLPNVLQAFFSILDAGKSIPAHDGPYKGYLRYHLALKVPAEDPPSMRVKDQIHTWEEGKSILFDDSWNHEVMNRSKDLRVVLIVDVLRPMSWPLSALNWLLTQVIGKRTEEAKQARNRIAQLS
jgi:aspartyl/asparaginyl beta-hydroxylase (cupin superfamily)